MKFKFNRKLAPICLVFFLLNLGHGFPEHYLVLLMRSLGLNLADASFVNGCVPFFPLFFSPIIGYIADKFGSKFVLICSFIGLMVTSTSLSFLPVYRKFDAKIGLDKTMFNHTLQSFDWKTIIWFGRYKDFHSNCEYESTENVIREISCPTKLFNVNIEFKVEDIENVYVENCTDLNTQTCKYVVKELNENETMICEVKFDNEDVVVEKGSHSLTFWSYFVLRILYKMCANVMYNITDAAAATIAIKEGTTFATVLFFGLVGGFIPNWITGPIVDHLQFGTDYLDCLTDLLVKVNDFKVPFFLMDACIVIAVIVCIFLLEVEIIKPEKKYTFKEEFTWLWNPAALGFYFGMFVMGALIGAQDTYLFVYAQEQLKASMSFLGYMNSSSITITILSMPFAKKIINYVGMMNTICLCMAIYCLRMIAYGLTYTSPPYPFIAFGGFNDVASSFTFVALITYTSVIAPQSLINTAISIGSVMCWIIGMSSGSLLSGLVVNEFSIRTMFYVFGTTGICYYMFYLILYHLVIRKYEINQNMGNKELATENCEEKVSSTRL